MTEILAYCGLICSTCPIYLATRQADKDEQIKMRGEIARLCREQYRMDYAPEDITDCDGCPVDGARLFSACTNCSIRKCAWEKGLVNCAYCVEYACERLEAFFATDPSARTRLDAIRGSLEGNI
jgi:hypothetical protein